jgi:hypothetical protein
MSIDTRRDVACYASVITVTINSFYGGMPACDHPQDVNHFDYTFVARYSQTRRIVSRWLSFMVKNSKP